MIINWGDNNAVIFLNYSQPSLFLSNQESMGSNVCTWTSVLIPQMAGRQWTNHGLRNNTTEEPLECYSTVLEIMLH